jgi:hypothetical protein
MSEKPEKQFVTSFIFEKLKDKISLSEDEIKKLKNEAYSLEIMHLTEIAIKSFKI